MRSLAVMLLVGALAPRVGWGAGVLVPPALRDVTGATVDVAALARRQRLVFVTVKASWCPVCRAQLQRLGRLLPRLRACGATFVVLAPGSNAALAGVARDTSFPYPFVADGAVAIAGAAGLVMAPDELVPAFFVVNAEREIVWQQRGRGDGAYGDGELLKYLGCSADADVRA
jgi:peroxiredoxin